MANVEKVTKEKKIPRGDHYWLDANGVVVESIDSATGYRYVRLDVDEKPDGHVDCQLSDQGVRLFALFGAKTKAINDASAARTRGEDELEAIRSNQEQINAGTWPEREGGGAPGYNIARLAEAVFNVLLKKKKVSEDQRAAYVSKIEAKLNEGGKDARNSAVSSPGVKDEYAKLSGKSQASVDDLLDFVA